MVALQAGRKLPRRRDAINTDAGEIQPGVSGRDCHLTICLL
jgi:hypothetical protein